MNFQRSFFGTSLILLAHLPISGAVEEAFFLAESKKGPIRITPSFSTADGTVTLAADVEASSGMKPLCAVVTTKGESFFFCDRHDVRIVEDRGTLDAELAQLQQDVEKAKQGNLAKEYEVRRLKATIGDVVAIENLVAVRKERAQTDETTKSLVQEKQALNDALTELRHVRPTEDAAILERSLQGVLQELEIKRREGRR